MQPLRTIDLTDKQRDIVARILGAARGKIGPVKVYGSRAMGNARPGSDLDLVVFPPAPHDVLGDLRIAFDESLLPITVDILDWEDIRSRRLRDEIDRYAVPWQDAG